MARVKANEVVSDSVLLARAASEVAKLKLEVKKLNEELASSQKQLQQQQQAQVLQLQRHQQEKLQQHEKMMKQLQIQQQQQQQQRINNYLYSNEAFADNEPEPPYQAPELRKEDDGEEKELPQPPCFYGADKREVSASVPRNFGSDKGPLGISF
jgi:hypothetical protein